MQQVQNGEMKYCLHKDNSIHNCAKHVWEFLMQEMVKKQLQKSHDVGFSAKRISTLKGHGDLCVWLHKSPDRCLLFPTL